ncbi:hypothetical protein [Kitasatospora sp. HPMI-4]|uniref:hypothetical protein n=1 Tax=Kitasatospora sp. HPMI-4 TaxID=3448443 RepID=UPI003F1CF1EF
MNVKQPHVRNVMDDIRKFLTCIGPTYGDSLDWNAVKAVYGRSFPADYQAFVTAFGSGSIEEVVGIRIPASTHEELYENKVSPLSTEALADDTVNRWSDPSQTGRHRLEDLLIWGETAAADTLCWIATDPAADQWPVAVYSRSTLAWSVYPGGMAEFLLRLLRDEFEEWPISDDSLRDISRPRFLHDKDEEAAWELGVNPWD